MNNNNSSASKKKPIKFKDFVVTLLEIIEDKRKPKFYPAICFLFVWIYWSHNYGYIFTTYASKPLKDQPSIYLAHWFEYSPVTFLLFVNSIDALTLYVFFTFQAIIYSFYLYILIITLIKHFTPKIYKIVEKSAFYSFYNYALNIFFSSFLWCFYTPFIEINLGMTFCGANSFLLAYRDPESCPKHPFILKLLGFTGLTLTCLMGLVIIFFYRSYEFLDANLLKRKYNYFQFIQLVTRTLITVFYYSSSDAVIIYKHICGHLVAIATFLEIMVYLSIKNYPVAIFYGASGFGAEMMMVVSTLWEVFNVITSYDLFFWWILSIPICTKFLMNYYENKYYNIISTMTFNSNENKQLDFLDFYLEELMTLWIQYKYSQNQTAYAKLRGILLNHKKNCNYFECYCKYEDYQCINKDGIFNEEIFIKMISFIFQSVLKNDKIRLSSSIRDQISLKFCSFQAVYEKNPALAFYQLQSLLQANDKGSSRTLFFTAISEIIENTIISMIQSNTNQMQTNKSDLNLTVFLEMEHQKKTFKEDIHEILILKRDYFKKLCLGFDSLDSLGKIAEEMVDKYNTINNNLSIYFSAVKTKQTKDIYVLAFLSIINSVVLNNHFNSVAYETAFNEIKKKDSYLDEKVLNSINILNGKAVACVISFLKQKNKIVNKITEKFAEFFNYEKDEMFMNRTLDVILPPLIKENHDIFIMNYFQKSHKNAVLHLEKSNFAVDKFGFIFPIKIYLNHTFRIKNDVYLATVFLKYKEYAKNIMIDENGAILGVSNKMFDTFKNSVNVNLRKLYNCNFNLFVPKLDIMLLNCKESDRKLIENKAVNNKLINKGVVFAKGF